MKPFTIARQIAVAAACLAVILAAPGVSAHAATTVRYGIQDDAWLRYGPGTLTERVDRLKAMGVRLVRINLLWNVVEPSAATYVWTGYDDELRDLHRAGIEPVLTLLATPAWANGGKGTNVAPLSGSAFAAFAVVALGGFLAAGSPGRTFGVLLLGRCGLCGQCRDDVALPHGGGACDAGFGRKLLQLGQLHAHQGCGVVAQGDSLSGESCRTRGLTNAWKSDWSRAIQLVYRTLPHGCQIGRNGGQESKPRSSRSSSRSHRSRRPQIGRAHV